MKLKKDTSYDNSISDDDRKKFIIQVNALAGTYDKKMNFTSTESENITDINIYNTTYGDKSSIKTIINYFIGNSQLNKILALVLFIISSFTSLLEIISYTFTDWATILFEIEKCQKEA